MDHKSTISNSPVARGSNVISDLGTFWTAANMLSLCRVVLSVPITYLILVDGPLAWLLGLILLAMVTDWFDGRLARWSHTVSDWGKVLDPLADKLMASAVTLALVIRGSLPLWFLALIILRDVIIVYGGVLVTRRTGEVYMSIMSGKLAVSALAVTVVAALLRADPPIMNACVAVTTALLLYSFLRYVIRGIQVARTYPRPEGNAAEVENRNVKRKT